MGVHPNIGYDKFPKSGEYLNRRVKVCFNYNTDQIIRGTIVRDDWDEPFRIIIRLDDGRHVLATECQYTGVTMEQDIQKTYTKEYVDNLFRTFGVLTVTFTKRNGDKRVMTCTKDLAQIPKEKHPTGESERKPNDEVCTVFEVGNDWRSFRFDSVTLIEYEKIDL